VSPGGAGRSLFSAALGAVLCLAFACGIKALPRPPLQARPGGAAPGAAPSRPEPEPCPACTAPSQEGPSEETKP
jgi:hypothetical protein